MPGAFTPTEILTAWEAGADIVKVFPADVLGPAFFKAVRGAAAAGAPDADRRRGPEHRGRLPARPAPAASASAASWSSRRPWPTGDFDRIRDLARQISSPSSITVRRSERAGDSRSIPIGPSNSDAARSRHLRRGDGPPQPAAVSPAGTGRSLDVQVGGAELNTAVGLARLGRSAAWVSRLTDNPLGRLVANQAREAGVSTEHVVWTPEDRVGVYYLEFGAAPRQQRPLRPQGGGHRQRPSGHGPLGRRVPRRQVVSRHGHHAGPQPHRRRGDARSAAGGAGGEHRHQHRPQLSRKAVESGRGEPLHDRPDAVLRCAGHDGGGRRKGASASPARTTRTRRCS